MRHRHQQPSRRVPGDRRQTCSWPLALTAAALLLAQAAWAETGSGPGSYAVDIESGGQWRQVGTLSFGKRLTTGSLALYDLDLSGPVRVRIEHRGPSAAHVDAVLLGGQPPLRASGTAEEQALALRKLSAVDSDVIDARERSLLLEFDAGAGPPVLSLTARSEPQRISEEPFQFPPENLYRPMDSSAAFYTYELGSRPGKLQVDGDLQGEELGPPLFKVFCRTGTGHPHGHTWGWVTDDGQSLYVALDFVPDNTTDGDKDYARVHVRTARGRRSFQVSMDRQRWGRPGFTYTERAAYQHKTYELRIPLSELGLLSARRGTILELAFAAYGTAAPPDQGPPDQAVPDQAVPDQAGLADSPAPDTGVTTPDATQPDTSSGKGGDTDEGGCDCAVTGPPGALALVLLLLLAVLLRRSR